jgi:hypothetical protein
MEQVAQCFDECGLEFICGMPAARVHRLRRGSLFEPQDRGSRLDHFLVQLREIATGSREGGLFIMIARKPAQHPVPLDESITSRAAHTDETSREYAAAPA